MASLTDLKSRCIQNLRTELSSIEKATASFELSLRGVSLHTNATSVNDKVQAIAAKINKEFVEEINSASYEEVFSDEVRLQCYEEFRNECGKIISEFTRVHLSTQ